MKSDGIYCLYCTHSNASSKGSSGKFVEVGYCGFRSDKLTKHESSTAHQNSADDYREYQARQSSQQSVLQVIQQSNVLTVDEEAFCDSLRCMYWLGKYEVPYTTLFSPLMNLGIALGNVSLPLLNKAKNLNYRSEQTKAEMLAAIGKSLEEELLDEIARSPYFSIVFDEATDISVSKQLGISVQYINVDNNTCIEVKFLKLVELSNGTADTICEAILQYLSKTAPITLNLEKLAGGATDGAAVMVGSQTGVVTRIKDVVPFFISTHCAAHRLSLVACDAADHVPEINRFQKVLNQLYVFFSRSSIRSNDLKEMEKVLNMPAIKLKQPTETRWLSHEQAVHSLRKCLCAIKATCEKQANEGDATALGLSTHLSKPNFIATLLLLSDILTLLGNLSRSFQVSTLNLLHIEGHVADTTKALNLLKEDIFSGSYMSTLQATLESIEVETGTSMDGIQRVANQYIAALVNNLECRFPQRRLVSLLGYFDPRNVKKATLVSMLELGNFLKVDGHKLWLEFRTYQSFVERLPQASIISAMQAMHSPDNKETMIAAYPLISDILARISTLPGSSAEVERVFSTMKRIKSPLRNRLSTTTTLDNLIRISMNGQSYGNRKLTRSR